MGPWQEWCPGAPSPALDPGARPSTLACATTKLGSEKPWRTTELSCGGQPGEACPRRRGPLLGACTAARPGLLGRRQSRRGHAPWSRQATPLLPRDRRAAPPPGAARPRGPAPRDSCHPGAPPPHFHGSASWAEAPPPGLQGALAPPTRGSGATVRSPPCARSGFEFLMGSARERLQQGLHRVEATDDFTINAGSRARVCLRCGTRAGC